MIVNPYNKLNNPELPKKEQKNLPKSLLNAAINPISKLFPKKTSPQDVNPVILLANLETRHEGLEKFAQYLQANS